MNNKTFAKQKHRKYKKRKNSNRRRYLHEFIVSRQNSNVDDVRGWGTTLFDKNTAENTTSKIAFRYQFFIKLNNFNIKFSSSLLKNSFKRRTFAKAHIFHLDKETYYYFCGIQISGMQSRT